MKVLYTIEEALNNPLIDTKAFMIPDINLAQLIKIEHYIRLLGLYDYIEVYRDPIHQSITIRYREEDFTNKIVPIGLESSIN